LPACRRQPSAASGMAELDRRPARWRWLDEAARSGHHRRLLATRSYAMARRRCAAAAMAATEDHGRFGGSGPTGASAGGGRRARRASMASVGGELCGLDGPGGPRAQARLRYCGSHLHPPSPPAARARRRGGGARAHARAGGAAELELAEAMARTSAPAVTAARSEMRGGGPPIYERKRDERVADVATGATWTGDVAENRPGCGSGGILHGLVSSRVWNAQFRSSKSKIG
jgi:hypothetical protein